MYFVIFGAAGSFFYGFAILCFLVGPVVGGIVAARDTESGRMIAFCISGGIVFGLSLIMFLLGYVVVPLFFITTINLPAMCDGTYHPAGLPAELRYTLPGGGEGIIVSEDTGTVIAVQVDYARPPHPATVFLANRSDGTILWSARFPGDNIAAALDNDTAYIFYEGLGYFIEKNTGQRYDRFLSMDNYGTNTNGKFQPSGIISTWKRDGTVKSLPRLTFNGIVRGCSIRGDTGEIIRL